MSKPLYLASMSPRRAELLSQLGLSFETVNAPIEEVALPNEDAESFVKRMAIEKALDGFNKLAGTHIWVIGGDTLVKVDNLVLGKPKNQIDAMRMWRKLSGRTHEVLSAVAVVNDGETFCAMNRTLVYFREINEQEMQDYWQTGEPIDKAGAYAIQGLGAQFIERIDGSYSAVMGLPLFELSQLLTQAHYYETFQ